MTRSQTPGPLATADSTDVPTTACAEHRDAFGILAHCHERILANLGVLENTALALREVERPTDEHLARLAEVLAFLDTAIPMHSADEEQTLFPRLRELPMFVGHAGGTPMDCMEKDHVVHADMKARLKRAIIQHDATAMSRAAKAMVSEYRSHIEKEDQILFPMARDLLTDPTVIDAMTAEMRERRRDVSC